jgi:uncharacterized membrane protein YraQ (UPF0718 family)
MNEVLIPIIVAFWGTVVQMAPYLLFGFAMAGLMGVIISRRFVETHLGGKGMLPVIKASVIGVPMPLCSCGVIPVATSLRRHGASKGATVSFLISTPETGVDSFFVTLSLLGGVMAVFRAIVAFISGIVGGGLVDLMDRHDKTVVQEEKCDSDGRDNAQKENRLVKAVNYGFVSLPRDIGKALLLGIAIAAIISAFVPDDFFQQYLPTGILSMLVMMAVGIPMYVCASASVPVAAALIAKGISPGAALVFLITGPATNGATIATVWKVLGWKTAVVYLLSIASCALAAGLLLDGIFPDPGSVAAAHIHHMSWSLVDHLLAVTLLVVLAAGILRKGSTENGSGGHEKP